MAEPRGARPSALDQRDDIAGAAIAYTDNDLPRNDVNEAGDPAIGRIQASATADATFSAPSGIQATLTVGTGTPFSAASVGDVLSIENSTTSSNDGVYLIIAFTSSTVVDVERLDSVTTVVAEAGADWYHALPYSLETDVQNNQTDRAKIKYKGTTLTDKHQADIPEYQRPSAVGTQVPMSLWNASGSDTAVQATWPSNTFGVTTDAKTEICELVALDIKMDDASALGDATSSTTSGDLTVAASSFTADSVGRILTLTGTNAGDWVITAFVSATSVTLRQLNGASAPADDTGITWTMYSDRRVITTSRGYADSVDLRGIPVADVGAEDETNYDATYTFVFEQDGTSGTAGFVKSTTEEEVWGRAFQALEGTDVMIRFFTGDNDGTATAYDWEATGPVTILLQIPDRKRLDELEETCRRKMLLTGHVLSDGNIVNDINELNSYTGRVDGETDTTWNNDGNYYALQGCATNLEAGINCLNDGIGDRDYSAFLESIGATDGDDITTVLNLIGDELALQSLDRYVYLVTATIPKFGTLSLSSFAGAPATYDKSPTGANCWLFVRGMLWHQGDIAAKGQYEEGADLGGGTANDFIVNSKININDWCDVIIR